MSDDLRTDLRALIERLHPDAYGWSLACCGWDRYEAEDVLQASYLKVIDGRARFDGRSSAKTWLFGVIRTTAAERRRAARRAGRALVRRFLASAEPRRVPGPDRRALRSEALDALVAALSRLSRRQRQVLTLVFWHEMTIEDAAAVMGVSLGSARVHYERGKSRLRGLLEDEKPPAGAVVVAGKAGEEVR